MIYDCWQVYRERVISTFRIPSLIGVAAKASSRILRRRCVSSALYCFFAPYTLFKAGKVFRYAAATDQKTRARGNADLNCRLFIVPTIHRVVSCPRGPSCLCAWLVWRWCPSHREPTAVSDAVTNKKMLTNDQSNNTPPHHIADWETKKNPSPSRPIFVNQEMTSSS